MNIVRQPRNAVLSVQLHARRISRQRNGRYVGARALQPEPEQDADPDCDSEDHQTGRRVLDAGDVDIGERAEVPRPRDVLRDAAEDFSLEAWQQVLQVNLTSVFQLCQLAGRDMLNRNAPGCDGACASRSAADASAGSCSGSGQRQGLR